MHFNRNGNDITSAQVGDHLALRFEILDRRTSPYEIFVRELVASDGIDASEILLVDAVGEKQKRNFTFLAVMIKCV